jgi:hypothetical protein
VTSKVGIQKITFELQNSKGEPIKTKPLTRRQKVMMRSIKPAASDMWILQPEGGYKKRHMPDLCWARRGGEWSTIRCEIEENYVHTYHSGRGRVGQWFSWKVEE